MATGTTDKIIAIALFILSAALYYISTQMPTMQYTIGSVGPSAFPKIICSLVALLAVALFFQARAQEKASSGASKPADLLKDNFKTILVVLITGLYIFLISYLGYLVDTFIYVSVITLLLAGKTGNKNRIIILAVSAVVTFVTYFIFSEVLSVFLPTFTLFES